MSVRTGQSITKVFTTRVFSTGVATNADSTPTGTLYVNGTADGASVTVTNVATGIYKAAVTMPTLAVGDIVDLRIAATVSSVSDTEVIWSDTKDIAADSSGKVPATIAAGDLATDSITAAALKADAVTEIQSGLMTSAGYTAPDNATISTIAGNIGTAGAGLTAIGDTRLNNLDDAVSDAVTAASSAASSASSAASSASTAVTQTTAANIRAAVGMSAADLDNQLDAILDANGSGASLVTITVNDGSTVIQNARVTMVINSSVYSATTNSSGVATLSPNEGNGTYSVRLTATGYQFTPTTLVVSGDTSHTYSMSSNSVSPPSNPSMSAIEVLCVDSSGDPEDGVSVVIRMIGIPSGSQNIAFRGSSQTAVSDADGIARFEVVQSGTYEWKRGLADVWQEVTIDADGVTNVTSVIGSP